MKIEQLTFAAGQQLTLPTAIEPDLVLAFADSDSLQSEKFAGKLLHAYPSAQVVFVSAPDHIAGSAITEGGGSATLISFDDVKVSAFATAVVDPSGSEDAGRRVGASLSQPGLRHVLLFSEGLHINGTALIRGLRSSISSAVTVSGGLASDGEAFGKTLVGLNSKPSENQVIGIGLSGEKLRVGMGSLGGWVPFGQDMLVSRSEGNVVYELDGRPALTVYRELLGSRAYALPASALLFPLNIKPAGGGDPLVRTLLGMNEDEQSVTFAGDIPEGCTAQVMQADLDQLIDAAQSAATMSVEHFKEPDLALLISCIGRKLLLQIRAQEEVAAARRIFGPNTCLTGFYSYGEISPGKEMLNCGLQNQTMTITTFTEREYAE